MKLTRNPTTDANPNLRGEKHYFTVENAPALMLEAMDELLEKAGWENDSCPCYDDGFGCGWWIDVEEVAAFKADYKRLKGEAAAYVNSKMAQHQGDTLDAMPVEDVEVVARVVRQVARDLRSKQESLSALRAIGTTRAIIMNPYYNTYRPLSQKGWELIHAVLMVGSLEDVISWLYALERNCEASTERRPAIAKLMQNVPGATHEEAHRAIRAANNIYDRAFQMLHDYQAAKEAHAEALAMNDAFDRSFHRRAANWGAMDWMSREIELEKAHEEALALDVVFRKAKARYDHFWGAYSYYKRRELVEKAHDAALIENDMFDGIIRDDLTPEQRAIQTRREGMDIYGEKFAQQYAKDYDEAWSYELKRNQAIRDEEVQLTTQIEFNKRQYIWEEVYSEEYKAIRLEVAHEAALVMAANYASADQMANEFLTEQAHTEEALGK